VKKPRKVQSTPEEELDALFRTGMVDAALLESLARQKDDENFDFRQFLKGHPNAPEEDEINELVFETTKRVWDRIDCTKCANCCKHVQPTLDENDVDRLANRLNMDRQRFIELYLRKNEDACGKPWITNSLPCAFLKDDRCSVYEDRPADCAGYPYLYEPDFTARMFGMLGRTFVCPIVYGVMEELKRELR
jgi:hypothetical protein